MRWLSVCLLPPIVAGCSGISPVVADYQPAAISPDAVVDAVPTADPISSGGNASPYTVFGKQYEVMPSATGYREEGIASWYGMKFQGRKTSNGEIFDVYQATAAHKALPLPTYLKVTNLQNNASMVVRVNDRGPFVDDRLIDVSYGVAVRLGFADQGTTRVRLEHVQVQGVDDWREGDQRVYRRLQVGAYQDRQAAELIAAQLEALLGDELRVQISEVTSGEATIFRVRIGPVGTADELGELQQLLLRHNLPSGQQLP